MSGKAFLDTNVLVYLFDHDSPAKQRRARAVLEAEGSSAAVSTHVLQEFYVTVTRKLGHPMPERDAEAAVHELAALEVIPVDGLLVLSGIARSRKDRLSLWDALIIEAALQGGCGRLLTEDLQDGRRFGALRVENPFSRS